MEVNVFQAIALVFALTSVPSIASEIDVDVAVALEKCRNSLVKIVSVDCEATAAETSGRKCSLRFLQDRDLFRVDRTDVGPFQVRGESFPPVVASMAYNGKKYQHLDCGLLQLSDVRSTSFLAAQPHLQAYDWLSVGFGASREQLLDEIIWQEVKSRCDNEVTIVEFENEECAVLTLKPKGGKRGEVKIFLAAKKGYFPMGFEGIVEGKPTLKFHVKETQSIRMDGLSFLYPIVLETVNYNLDGSISKETICKVDPSSLKVNKPINKTRFTIVALDTEVLDHNVLNASVRRIPKDSWWSGSVVKIAIGAAAAAVAFAFVVWMRSNAKT